MLNFLLLATGIYAASDENSTDLQKSMGTALMGVGLARVVNELAKES